ncbi:MAG: 3-deoxy-D-manno-octulosonic acid transferase [Candidatus Hinthialibacter antarcticus]|nr:3-deoxy-D-manno-octulosonic acid transferase [Candidatus Hinthialibacter antarcticus]
MSDSLWYWSPLMYAGYAAAAPLFGARMLSSDKYRIGLSQRLTFYPSGLQDKLAQKPNLWLHAVSVGELQAARGMLSTLSEAFPQANLAVSTVTNTGQSLARQLDDVDAPFYLPLDLYPLCRRAVRMVNPAALIIMETELWPNLIRAATDEGVPVFLINARLSDKSFGNYLRARVLFQPLLNRLQGILAQSDEDARRFILLGANQERVASAGNVKFEVSIPEDGANERTHWRSLFQIEDDELLLIAGSTFDGEEALLAQTVRAMRNKGIPIRLVIAPRHVERTPSIEQELTSTQTKPVLRSKIIESQPMNPEAPILLDTIGELGRAYAAADVVFVGKSICSRGGQNPIEPAAWSKPVVFGPNMQNFRDAAAMLLREGGARQVSDARQLTSVLCELCQSEDIRNEMGERARQVVKTNRGALQRTFDVIAPVIESRLTEEKQP